MINFYFWFCDFQMIPKISLDSRIDESRKQLTQTQNVTNHIVINSPSDARAQPGVGPSTPKEQSDEAVKYSPETSPYAFIQPPQDLFKYESVEVRGVELDKLIKENKEFKAENTALQIIQQMMKENPLYINKLILVDDEKLKLLIKLFTDAEDVKIEIAEFDGTSCCSFSDSQRFRFVHAIYVIKDGLTKNLKYDYPEVTRRISELGINLKVVF